MKNYSSYMFDQVKITEKVELGEGKRTQISSTGNNLETVK